MLLAKLSLISLLLLLLLLLLLFLPALFLFTFLRSTRHMDLEFSTSAANHPATAPILNLSGEDQSRRPTLQKQLSQKMQTDMHDVSVQLSGTLTQSPEPSTQCTRISLSTIAPLENRTVPGCNHGIQDLEELADS